MEINSHCSKPKFYWKHYVVKPHEQFSKSVIHSLGEISCLLPNPFQSLVVQAAC